MKKSCKSGKRCAGINKKTGRLKKGYKYGKGGKVVKAKKS